MGRAGVEPGGSYSRLGQVASMRAVGLEQGKRPVGEISSALSRCGLVGLRL